MAKEPEHSAETSEQKIEDLEVTDEKAVDVGGAGASTALKFSASSVLKAEINSTRK